MAKNARIDHRDDYHQLDDCITYHDGRKRHRLAVNAEDRFYNLKKNDADFGYWGRLDSWTAEEALAISFGKNPRVVRSVEMDEYTGICSYAKDYMERKDLIDRALRAGKLVEPIEPRMFITWAEAKRISLSPELVQQVDIYKIDTAKAADNDWKSRALKITKDYIKAQNAEGIRAKQSEAAKHVEQELAKQNVLSVRGAHISPEYLERNLLNKWLTNFPQSVKATRAKKPSPPLPPQNQID